MRRLRPDPVPDEMLQKLVQAASWAPTRGEPASEPLTLYRMLRGFTPAQGLRLLARSVRLELLGEASSVYPGVQNVLLAARALGLGAVITIGHLMLEQEWKRELGIPRHIRRERW